MTRILAAVLDEARQALRAFSAPVMWLFRPRTRFWVRSRAGLGLLRLGLWLLPACRYKTELSGLLWVLNLRVQSSVAANRAAQS
jgi:hypothetical protein